jgi:hypothetical protein
LNPFSPSSACAAKPQQPSTWAAPNVAPSTLAQVVTAAGALQLNPTYPNFLGFAAIHANDNFSHAA